MSTKTLRKRIALVAVSALGAGLLSVVAVPSANAAVPPEGKMFISTTATTTGKVVVSSDTSSAKSLGFITATSTTGLSVAGNGYALTAGTAATALVYAGAKLAWAATATTGAVSNIGVVVTGATLEETAATNGTGATVAIAGDRTTAVSIQTGTSSQTMYGSFLLSAAAGTTATIAIYEGTGIAGLTTATNGSLMGIYTFTVASGSAAGVISLADSSIYQQASTSAGIQASGTNAYDTSSRIDNGKIGIVYVSLKDAYTSAVTTGTTTVSATNGASVNLVKTSDLAASNSYAATTSFDSDTLAAGTGYIYVKQPVANVAGTTTITITNNGTVLATKTLNWNGDIASLAVVAADSSANFENGLADDPTVGGSVVYQIKDAAGNVLNASALPTMGSGSTGALVGASIGTTANGTAGVLQTAALGYGVVTMVIPVSALNGAGTYRLKTTNAAGVSVYSAVQSAVVSNGPTNSHAITWDKKSYAPGEIATVTYTLKDAYGNLMADGTAAAGWAGAVGTTTELIAVGTACSASKYTIGGSFTCKYGVGNVAGSYSYSFDLTTATPQSATIGSIAITGSGVSNADVLKAIVSLIASINKQIAALQKALLKK
jgi:hypothetical protein